MSVQLRIDGNWILSETQRFYYHSGPNSITYKEVSFWYNKDTMERTDTVRSFILTDAKESNMPDWCQCCEYRKQLNTDWVPPIPARPIRPITQT